MSQGQHCLEPDEDRAEKEHHRPPVNREAKLLGKAVEIKSQQQQDLALVRRSCGGPEV